MCSSARRIPLVVALSMAAILQTSQVCVLDSRPGKRPVICHDGWLRSVSLLGLFDA
uniref:Uncharacterized protein n=1 Tax=Mycobacterium riyadhense TaxID=486698 RepID=A0A653EU92_9MYCO|nr:hypothetical protein BIN_B_03822 [Mycobacterium riyadhense]